MRTCQSVLTLTISIVWIRHRTTITRSCAQPSAHPWQHKGQMAVPLHRGPRAVVAPQKVRCSGSTPLRCAACAAAQRAGWCSRAQSSSGSERGRKSQAGACKCSPAAGRAHCRQRLAAPRTRYHAGGASLQQRRARRRARCAAERCAGGARPQVQRKARLCTIQSCAETQIRCWNPDQMCKSRKRCPSCVDGNVQEQEQREQMQAARKQCSRLEAQIESALRDAQSAAAAHAHELSEAQAHARQAGAQCDQLQPQVRRLEQQRKTQEAEHSKVIREIEARYRELSTAKVRHAVSFVLHEIHVVIGEAPGSCSQGPINACRGEVSVRVVDSFPSQICCGYRSKRRPLLSGCRASLPPHGRTSATSKLVQTSRRQRWTMRGRRWRRQRRRAAARRPAENQTSPSCAKRRKPRSRSWRA
jgi:hypothetical protein